MLLPNKYTAEEIQVYARAFEAYVRNEKMYGPLHGYHEALMFNECCEFLEKLGIPYVSEVRSKSVTGPYRTRTLILKNSFGLEFRFYTSSNKWKAKNNPTVYRSKGLTDFLVRFLKVNIPIEEAKES